MACPNCANTRFERNGALVTCTAQLFVGIIPGRPIGPHPMYGNTPDQPIYQRCDTSYIADAVIVTVL